MVMVTDPNGKEFYMDGYLYNSFQSAKVVMIKKDLDLPILISGYPGTGKTTIACQLATFCDSTFNEDRICVDTPSFIEAIKRAEKRQAVILDESFEHLNSSEIRREMGRVLSNMLNIVRQKNLYIFIIIPNFFDMGKQISVFRTRWLIHCYSESFGDIGRFCAFDRGTKHQLYIKGKKDNNYSAVKSDFFGKFTSFIPTNIDYQKYLDKKAEGLQNIFKTRETTLNVREQRNRGIIHLREEFKYTVEQLAKVFDMTERTIYSVLSQNKKMEEKKE